MCDCAKTVYGGLEGHICISMDYIHVKYFRDAMYTVMTVFAFWLYVIPVSS